MGKVLTRISIVAAVALCAASACNTSGCLGNQSSVPLAGFYSMETKNNITLDSVAIGGGGAPDDSLLLSPGTTAARIYLPLRSDASTVTYFIRYCREDLDTAALNDTIWIRYDSNIFFVSEECGAMYNYTITSIDHTCHFVDSIGVADSTVNNVDIERFRIYFKAFPTDSVAEE